MCHRELPELPEVTSRVKNTDLVLALCRFRGIQKGLMATRCECDDLKIAGAWFDKASEDAAWMEEFAVWLVGLAVTDINETGKGE